VALTGATGFIGGALRQTLVQSGVHVRALTRRPQPLAENVTWIHGSLETPAALTSLLAGAHSIIHCAGAVRGKSLKEFNRVNVAGTQAIISACLAQNPPPRLLFISTLAARSPELSWYATSKAAAEDLIRAQGQRLRWTIFRPTAVYGPGDREMRPLFQWLLRGVLPTLQPPGGRFSLLHVDDLASAVMQWLRQPLEANAMFELCDGTENGYDAGALARLVETHQGRRVRVLNLPISLLRLAARANLCLARVTGRSPMLTPGKVRELIHPDWTADSGRFTRATGWSARVRFMDALAAGRLFFT
jgi:nucleoside-diphosphate-sugar epimerase